MEYNNIFNEIDEILKTANKTIALGKLHIMPGDGYVFYDCGKILSQIELYVFDGDNKKHCTIDELLSKGNSKQVVVNDTSFIVYDCGKVLRKIKLYDLWNTYYADAYREIPNTPCKTKGGRNVIKCSNLKSIFRDHLIVKSFLNLSFYTPIQIKHIDGNNLNNEFINLKIIN